MPNPQQPEMRRTERTSVTNEPAPEATDPKKTGGGHAHGTDKGSKGGGKGGGTPPDQRPPHPD
ncbi:hypothetical protein GCM10010182_05550 [Actinomadura cremea]|nr:hypothetical protein GCM10010182_05550 [Actinomadura cremea]